MDTAPLCLHESTVSLYRATADDAPGEALWLGAQPEVARLGEDLQSVRVAATGARFASRHHVDGEHVVELESLWLLKPNASEDVPGTVRYGRLRSDHRPARGERLVLEIIWEGAQGERYGRRYTGVTADGYRTESRELYEFAARLAFHAEECTEIPYLETFSLVTSDGPLAATGGALVGTP